MADYDDTVARYATGARPTTPRAEPAPMPVRHPFVSVDDHVVEPPHTFVDHAAPSLRDRVPRIERGDDGIDRWRFEDDLVPLLSTDAHQTWDPDQWCVAPVNLDEIRRGTWDIDARVRDMDLAGVAASCTFPSTLFGFAGQRFMRFRDHALGLASLRAYNDWVALDWSARHPGRIIACALPWLADPVVGAEEVRRNAARGVHAVAFTENPEPLGLPSLYSGAWDPFFAACEETGTVINLHVGSSSHTIVPSSASPPQVLGALFPVNALQACLDWIFAKIPLRFPSLRIVLSEGGIGWVPMLIDRLRYQQHIYVPDGLGRDWAHEPCTPEELLRRNFWFTSYFEPLSFALRHEIGIDRIMIEADYPHADSTWPGCQDAIVSCIGDLPADEIERITRANACAVYRHDLTTVPV